VISSTIPSAKYSCFGSPLGAAPRRGRRDARLRSLVGETRSAHASGRRFRVDRPVLRIVLGAVFMESGERVDAGIELE
jgi:hypothetical protein